MKTQFTRTADDGCLVHFCLMCREYLPETKFSSEAMRTKHRQCSRCNARRRKDRAVLIVSTVRKRERARGMPCDPTFDAADVRALFALFENVCALTGEKGPTLTVIRAHGEAPLGRENALPVLSKFGRRGPPRTREEHEADVQRRRNDADARRLGAEAAQSEGGPSG